MPGVLRARCAGNQPAIVSPGTTVVDPRRGGQRQKQRNLSAPQRTPFAKKEKKPAPGGFHRPDNGAPGTPGGGQLPPASRYGGRRWGQNNRGCCGLISAAEILLGSLPNNGSENKARPSEPKAERYTNEYLRWEMSVSCGCTPWLVWRWPANHPRRPRERSVAL